MRRYVSGGQTEMFARRAIAYFPRWKRDGVRNSRAPGPKSGVVHYDYAMFLFREGKIDQSIPEFQAALKRSPNHPEAHYHLGRALFVKGDFEGAKLHYFGNCAPRSQSARAQWPWVVYIRWDKLQRQLPNSRRRCVYGQMTQMLRKIFASRWPGAHKAVPRRGKTLNLFATSVASRLAICLVIPSEVEESLI